MTQGTHDQVEGAVHEIKGDLKRTAGKITNNPDLQAEGANEKLAGTVQRKIGEIEKVLEK